MTPEEARAALDGVDEVQHRLAEGPRYPFWRHAAFGVIMALFVLAMLLPSAMMALPTALGAVGTVLLVQSDKEKYGVFVNGYQKGPTRPLTFALVAVILTLLGLAIWMREIDGPLWAKIALPVAAWVVATGASLWWTAIYDRSLKRGSRQ